MIDGKKTYSIALLMIGFAAIALYLGKIDDVNAIRLVLEAAALAGVRHAIEKK
jgi:hypothetical protein